MKKTAFIFAGLFLSSMLNAQTKITANWADFGIQNADTVLRLNVNEHTTSNRTSLFFADYRQQFDVSFSLKCNTLGTEQVFLCKDGRAGEMYADLSVGYDPMMCQIFAEIKDADGELHRIGAGEKVRQGSWYDVRVAAEYNAKRKRSTLTLEVALRNGQKWMSEVSYKGPALRYNVGRWVIGHGFPGGFPNSLQVRQGEMANLSVSGMGFPHKTGQNPLFTGRYTADPACLVVGDRVYAFVGEDKAGPGGWFNMPHWLCYSSDDMINWTFHGEVLRAGDFHYANPYGAWAAQVVEKDGKYYFYVTLDDRRNGQHTIDVAVSDNPTGPYRPARTDGTPLITDDMTPDSHRRNADIDPTVLIDDDGTPWMAWGNGDCYMVRLKDNMIELDGEVKKVPMRNYSEGPWLFKRKNIYYNVYASDAPGVQPEQMAYSMAPSIEGPWSFGGMLTGPAKHGFTIHPSIIQFKGKWYFIYHDGSYMQNGQPGGDCRRSVCAEYLHFNRDGSIRPITLTEEGLLKKK